MTHRHDTNIMHRQEVALISNWHPSETDIAAVKQEYAKHVKLLAGKTSAKQEEKQKPLWQLLAIGRLNQQPSLVLDLASAYTHARIEHYIEHYTHNENANLRLKEWVDTYQLVDTLTGKNESNKQIIVDALPLYFARVLRKVNFRGQQLIDDRIQPFAKYMDEALSFVRYMDEALSFAKNPTRAPYPMQFDVWIIPRAAVKAEDVENSDDEPDEEDVSKEEKSQDLRTVDIEATLARLNVAFVRKKRTSTSHGLFHEMLDELKEKLALSPHDEFPKHRRLACIVDRRQHTQDKTDKNDNNDNNKNNTAIKPAVSSDANRDGTMDDVQTPWPAERESDTLYMYQPSDDEKITYESMPEQLIQNTVQNILGHGHNAQDGSAFMFVLSFHVMAEDETKCYLYHKQQRCRMQKEHIYKLWPHFFVDDDVNKQFIQQLKQTKMAHLSRLQSQLKDKKFEKFRKLACKKREN